MIERFWQPKIARHKIPNWLRNRLTPAHISFPYALVQSMLKLCIKVLDSYRGILVAQQSYIWTPGLAKGPSNNISVLLFIPFAPSPATGQVNSRVFGRCQVQQLCLHLFVQDRRGGVTGENGGKGMWVKTEHEPACPRQLSVTPVCRVIYLLAGQTTVLTGYIFWIGLLRYLGGLVLRCWYL